MNEWKHKDTHFYLDFILCHLSNIFSCRFFAWKDCEEPKKKEKEKKGINFFFHNSCHFPYLFIKKIKKKKNLGHAFRHGLCILLGLLQQHHNAKSSLDFYENK